MLHHLLEKTLCLHDKIFMSFQQAQQVERDAMDLKGCVRKRMEFLYLDWLQAPPSLVHVHYHFGVLKACHSLLLMQMYQSGHGKHLSLPFFLR